MQKIPFQSERPLLRIGSITFLTGLAIFIISSAFHAGREDPTNHLLVFAEYANSPPWIAAHIGQFVGDITNLHQQYPEVNWRRFKDWVKSQNWDDIRQQ